MNRVTMTFIFLLAITTLAAGELWTSGSALLDSQITLWNIALAIFSTVALSTGVLLLGRMVYSTVPIPNQSLEEYHE